MIRSNRPAASFGTDTDQVVLTCCPPATLPNVDGEVADAVHPVGRSRFIATLCVALLPVLVNVVVAVQRMPASVFSRVDFPVPLAPTNAVRSPGVISQFAPSKRIRGPKRLPAEVSCSMQRESLLLFSHFAVGLAAVFGLGTECFREVTSACQSASV